MCQHKGYLNSAQLKKKNSHMLVKTSVHIY